MLCGLAKRGSAPEPRAASAWPGETLALKIPSPSSVHEERSRGVTERAQSGRNMGARTRLESRFSEAGGGVVARGVGGVGVIVVVVVEDVAGAGQ